jgi:hypothetical protein
VIDYFAHLAVLNQVRGGVAGIQDARVVHMRDSLRAVAAAFPEATLLGCVFDHLMMHTESTAAELDILANAANLWQKGRAMMDQIGQVRDDVHAVMAKPAALDATDRMNGAMNTLLAMQQQLPFLQAELDRAGSDVTRWRHLPQPHPRQQDRGIAKWDWGDRFLARRTDAFVRATFKHAAGRRGHAFAMGVLASYAGNVGGSAYLGQLVGGPRRLHPRRDRIARNTVGAWLQDQGALPSLETLQAGIGLNAMAGSAGTLRPDLQALLQDALQEAFPGMPPADLSGGFARLTRHLGLLAGFALPSLPPCPPATLMANMAPLDASMGAIASDPQDPGDEPYGPPPPPGPGSTTGGQPRGKDIDSGDACLIGLALVTVLYFLISGIVALAQGKKWDPFGDLSHKNSGGASDPGYIGVNSQQLIQMAGDASGTLMLSQLYNLHTTVWQAMSECRTILAKKGMIYPDALQLGSDPFAQFTALPAPTGWPVRTELTADEAYLDFPAGPVEHAAATASPYPAGATPSAFAASAPQGAAFVPAANEAVRLWLQIALREHDSFNRDLDADRGEYAECWQVAEKTSIKDDPVSVDILPYAAL